MRVTSWALLVGGLVIVAPILVIVIIFNLPGEWRDVAQDFQTLLGGSVALGAAIIAFINVGLQIRAAEDSVQRQILANRENVSRQIDAARTLEDDRRRFEKDQLKMALAAELRAFLKRAKDREVVSYYKSNAEHIRKSGKFVFWSIALSRTHDTVFKQNAASIGKLEGDLPESVIAAYSGIDALFDRLSAAERGDYNNLPPEEAVDMMNLISQEAEDAIAAADGTAKKLKPGRSSPASS